MNRRDLFKGILGTLAVGALPSLPVYASPPVYRNQTFYLDEPFVIDVDGTVAEDCVFIANRSLSTVIDIRAKKFSFNENRIVGYGGDKT